jgi:Fur family peroxide stress response transcriptional regulator
MASLPPAAKELLDQALAQSGLRSTRQRELIFEILLRKRDHPTADEVYARARSQVDSVSLATVYNCLETLVSCGLVRAVNYEREPTRFCPNLTEHAHFQDRKTGRVYDVDLPPEVIAQLRELLPDGYRADSVELYFHGQTENREGQPKL